LLVRRCAGCDLGASGCGLAAPFVSGQRNNSASDRFSALATRGRCERMGIRIELCNPLQWTSEGQEWQQNSCLTQAQTSRW